MRSLLQQPGASWWRRLTLLDVIACTLPPMTLALWLFCSSVLDYRRVRQFDDWWSSSTSVRKFGWYRLRTALRSFDAGALDRRLSAEREDTTQLRLLVDRADWDRIDGDVGAHFGEWIDVEVLDAGDRTPAELRFRGDGSAHWTTEKKSFTLKTKSDDLYKGFRTMAFSVKDVLPQYLVGSLAKDFGLLAPEQRIVPVFLNDRFYGVHRFVEPVDEAFLRRNVRLPGNIFRADTAERGDYFKGLPREVFANPYIWDRAAKNDRPGAIGGAALGEFIRDINGSTAEDHERLMARLDTAELSRLLAFLLVCGDPYHMSGVHNQFWYEDPADGKFHPIVWDVRLLDLERPPPGSNINRFWRAVLKDPRVWSGAMGEVARWLEGDKLYKLAEQRVNAAWERHRDAFEYDTLRSGVIPPVGDPATTLATLRKNLDTLRTWVADARASVGVTPSKAGDEWVIDVEVSGLAPCALTGFDLELSIDAEPVFDRFDFDSNGNGVRDSADQQLGYANLQSSGFFRPDHDLRPSIGGRQDQLLPQGTHFRFFYDPNLMAGTLSAVRLRLVNALDGRSAVVTALAPGTPLPARRARIETDTGNTVAWVRGLYGAVARSEDLVVDPGDGLAVRPGTTLTLDPNVSILIKGKAEFLGTEEAPITIQRSNPDLPWGVIAIQGAGASGSRFSHVRFLGGGGGQLEGVEYTGSVCVHYATGVVFDHCEFAANSRCDDLLHVDKGDATVTDCWFHDANSDALDFDMSSGLVTRNKIEHSGNDGLDLMTCWPRIVDNDITGSADKGISIGEASTPLVLDNRIEGCERGIEVKDRSAPIVLHTSITNCKRGVYAHLKNPRYGEAGWPTLARSVVRGNGTDYVVANDAQRTLAGSLIGAGSASDVLPDAGDLEWLMRWQGVVPRDSAPGATQRFELTEPLAPLFEGAFEEDFVEPQDGWVFDGDVTRLAKRKHVLVASFERRTGRIGHGFDWKLGDAAQEYVLVLELAGEGLGDVTATVASKQGDVVAPLALSADPSTYGFAVVHLPARNYDGVMLSATPTAERAKLQLRTWRVFGWPKSGGK